MAQFYNKFVFNVFYNKFRKILNLHNFFILKQLQEIIHKDIKNYEVV